MVSYPQLSQLQFDRSLREREKTDKDFKDPQGAGKVDVQQTRYKHPNHAITAPPPLKEK
jgi:hypothetical protein